MNGKSIMDGVLIGHVNVAERLIQILVEITGEPKEKIEGEDTMLLELSGMGTYGILQLVGRINEWISKPFFNMEFLEWEKTMMKKYGRLEYTTRDLFEYVVRLVNPGVD